MSGEEPDVTSSSVELQEVEVRNASRSLVAVGDPRLLPQALERAKAHREEYMAHLRAGDNHQSRFQEMCKGLPLASFFENTFDIYVRVKVHPYKIPFTTGVLPGVTQACEFQSQNSFEFGANYSPGDSPLLHLFLYDKQRIKDHTLGECVINAMSLIENKNETVTLDGIVIKEATPTKDAHFAGDIRLEGRFDGKSFSFKVKSLSNLVHKHAQKKSNKSGRVAYVATAIVIAYLGIGVAFFMTMQEWSFIEALFFCLITLTTVGFGSTFDGDNPALLIVNSPGRMWFVTVYALVGISMIAAALGIVGGTLIENISHAPIFHREAKEDLDDVDGRAALKEIAGRSVVGRVSACTKATPSSMWLFLCMLVLGTLFFGLVPNAATAPGTTDWTLIQAFYFCVVTLATIGYGDLYIQTDRGRIFAVFWMTFGTLVTAKCVGDLLNLYLEYRAKNLRADILLHAFKTEADIASFDENGDGVVSEVEWTQKMLVKLKLVSQEHLDSIHQQFKFMDSDNTGDISLEEIRRLFKLGPYIDPNYVPPPKAGAMARLAKAMDDVVGQGDAGQGVGGVQNKFHN